jgi:cytochrome P450
MAGGGTMADACRAMGRRCLSYDIAPKRDDVEKHDIAKGFPKAAENCDLIFLDPPYWRLQRENYSSASVSNLTYEEWLKFMEHLAEDCHITVEKGGHVALLVSAFLDEKVTGRFLDLPFKCTEIFLKAGFIEVNRVSAPINSEVKSVQDVEMAKRRRIMLDLLRDLIVFKKQVCRSRN